MNQHTGHGAKQIIWNGRVYPSIKQAAKELRLHYNTMLWRIRNGYTCDADLTGNRKKVQS